MKNTTLAGHILALLTVVVWGTTFTSTKILLNDFTPVEILFNRFFLALIALWLMHPHKLKLNNPKEEWYFAGAGLAGITCYYLFENIAINLSTASNVGIILSIAPFFTGILAHRFLESEKLSSTFFISFTISMLGVVMVSYNGSETATGNLFGDFLAVSAAFAWGCYSVLVKKINGFNYNMIAVTRRIFLYGVLFILPTLPLFGYTFNVENILKPVNFLNLIFLGLVASALCFVTWNQATKYIGAIKTSMYIYAAPIVTVTTAVIILNERITFLMVLGTIFLLTGLIIAERRK